MRTVRPAGDAGERSDSGIQPRPFFERGPALVTKTTISDVARAAGVSTAAVSQALNGKGRLSADTRSRIRALAEQFEYRPHPHARALRSGATLSIGLITSHLADQGDDLDSRLDWYLRTAMAAAAASVPHHCGLVLLPPFAQEEWDDVLHVDGVLLIDPDPDSDLVAALLGRRLPMVVIGGRLDDPRVGSVLPDEAAAVELAMDHLVSTGSRQPALLLDGTARRSNADRHRAYEAWCRSHDVAPLAAVVDDAGSRMIGGYRACLDLLDEHPAVDGLYVPLDSNASGCALAADAIGRCLPNQLRIVTSEGKLARESTTPMSAIDPRREEIAEMATSMLIGQLRGEREPSTVTVAPSLVPRIVGPGQ